MTPQPNSPCPVRWATPGVVSTPADLTAAPWVSRPPAINSATRGPDSRVSIPIKTAGPIKAAGRSDERGNGPAQ